MNLARPVGSLFDQRLVELSAGTGVDVRPAELAVVLQTCDVSAEEGRKLASAARPLTLVTQLVVQNVRLHLHLRDTDFNLDRLSLRSDSRWLTSNMTDDTYGITHLGVVLLRQNNQQSTWGGVM